MQTLTTLQAGKSCTVDELVKKFGLTRRTIFRDLQDLKNIGIPYQRDPKTGSYSIDSRHFLAPIDFELHEALSLLLMVNKAANLMQLPFKGPAVQASAKIVYNLPDAPVTRTCKIFLPFPLPRPLPNSLKNSLNYYRLLSLKNRKCRCVTAPSTRAKS